MKFTLFSSSLIYLVYYLHFHLLLYHLSHSVCRRSFSIYSSRVQLCYQFPFAAESPRRENLCGELNHLLLFSWQRWEVVASNCSQRILMFKIIIQFNAIHSHCSKTVRIFPNLKYFISIVFFI